MFKSNNFIKILVTSIILIIMVNTKVMAADFQENIKLLEGEMTIENSKKFIQMDKDYLYSSPSQSNINSEIKNLEAKLEEIEKEYKEIKGIKIYKGNIGLKNNAIRTAIQNRKNYKENKNFKYDDKSIYTIDRGYTKEAGSNKYFSQEEMDLTYESIVEVIENIEMEVDFLEDTTFVISPFILDGMNGYTVSRSNNHSTIVISNHVFGAPRDWIKKSTKSTVLHEIGHVFQNSNQEKFEKNIVAKDYLLQADKKLQGEQKESSSKAQKWKTSVDENFAEDFKTHYSVRLGESSFKPLKKKTPAKYNEKEFAQVIEEITK